MNLKASMILGFIILLISACGSTLEMDYSKQGLNSEKINLPGKSASIAPYVNKAIARLSGKGGGTLKIPKGSYSIFTTEFIKLQSNVTLDFKPGSTIQLKRNTKSSAPRSSRVFFANADNGENVENVTIDGNGLIVIGLPKSKIPNFGLNVNSNDPRLVCQNLLFRNIEFQGFSAYGFSVGGSGLLAKEKKASIGKVARLENVAGSSFKKILLTQMIPVKTPVKLVKINNNIFNVEKINPQWMIISKRTLAPGSTNIKKGMDVLLAGCPNRLIFDGVKCINNKNNGGAITQASNVQVINCVFKNTFGNLPGDGLDLEPNAGNFVSNVSIQNSEFSNNYYHGLHAHQGLGIFTQMTELKDCIFDDNRLNGVTITQNSESLKIDNCQAKGNGGDGFHLEGKAFSINNATSINNTVGANLSGEGFNVTNSLFRENDQYGVIGANLNLSNSQFLKNTVGIVINQAHTTIIRNCKFIDQELESIKANYQQNTLTIENNYIDISTVPNKGYNSAISIESKVNTLNLKGNSFDMHQSKRIKKIYDRNNVGNQN